nr:hypothetical protein [Klebsiella pneumoniae subsp. pneumoniae]
MLDKLQQVGAVLRPDGLEATALQRRFQFFDRLVFVVDAVRPMMAMIFTLSSWYSPKSSIIAIPGRIAHKKGRKIRPLVLSPDEKVKRNRSSSDADNGGSAALLR